MDGIKDIVPDLLQAILDSYHDSISKNKELQDLIDTIKEGKGDYNTMLRAATIYGNCLSGAFAKNIDADILPDGKMYYNIAERLLTPLVKENYDNVAPLCMDVQQVLNKQNGINLQPVKPSYKVDKTKGMASYVSNGDTYNQRMWSFLQSLETNSKSIVDDSVKENCEFQAKSGMSPVIERHASAKACEWCQEMEGTYRYPYDVPDDVYRRHDNCNCTVVYKPDKRAKDFQDVWSKKWGNEEAKKRIEFESKKNTESESKNKQFLPESRSGDNVGILLRGINNENVTSEYFRNATPNEGKIEFGTGYIKDKNHKNEIRVAELLHSTFGGDIYLITENNVTQVPDYLWNGKFWDLKTPKVYTKNNIDKLTQKGIQQITEIPGGIVFDLSNIPNYNSNLVESWIRKRFDFSGLESMDVIIVKDNDIVKVVKMEKRKK